MTYSRSYHRKLHPFPTRRSSDLTTHRASAIDARTTRHEGYAISQRKRKKVEEIFGWLKTVGLMRKTRHRGADRVGWMRSEEHTSELQSGENLVCRLLLEKKKFCL